MTAAEVAAIVRALFPGSCPPFKCVHAGVTAGELVDFFECSLRHEAGGRKGAEHSRGSSRRSNQNDVLKRSVEILSLRSLPFQEDEGVHRPWQIKEGFVTSDCVHSLLGDHLGFERWEELGEPVREVQPILKMYIYIHRIFWT